MLYNISWRVNSYIPLELKWGIIKSLSFFTHNYKEKNMQNNLMGDNCSSAWDISQVIPLDVCAASSNNKAANKSKTAKDIILLYGKAKLYEQWLFRLNANLHGPTKAIPMANNDPKSCPRVAPAPINPNNLEPDWNQSMLNRPWIIQAKTKMM